MSDEDRDVDIESDEDDDGTLQGGAGTQFMTQAEKRAHHNALERKRRDHIKESFHGLRDSVPSLQGEKASRAQILEQASEYISHLSKKNTLHHDESSKLKKTNGLLEQQVRALERAKAAGMFASQSAKQDGRVKDEVSSLDDGSISGSSDSENLGQGKRKKLKVSHE